MEYVIKFLIIFGILCIIDLIIEFKRINGWYDCNEKTLYNLYEYAKKNNDMDPDSFKELLDCVPISEYEFSGVAKIIDIIVKKWNVLK